MAQGQKGFYAALGAIALAGAGWLVYTLAGGSTPTIPVNATITAADTAGWQGYVLGDPNAPVEVIEYADFQCPGCAQFATVQFPDVKNRLIDAGKARFIHRDFPLDNAHPQARLAAHTAACANDQGKFWPVEEQLYVRQSEWAMNPRAYKIFTDIASQAGLDVSAWKSCMDAGTHAGRIQASLEQGNRLGVGSTPTFLIDGKLYLGMGADQMVQVVDSLIAARAAAQPAEAPAQ